MRVVSALLVRVVRSRWACRARGVCAWFACCVWCTRGVREVRAVCARGARLLRAWCARGSRIGRRRAKDSFRNPKVAPTRCVRAVRAVCARGARSVHVLRLCCARGVCARRAQCAPACALPRGLLVLFLDRVCRGLFFRSRFYFLDRRLFVEFFGVLGYCGRPPAKLCWAAGQPRRSNVWCLDTHMWPNQFAH